MTQDDYKLWTGETVTYEDKDWERLVSVASGRLASFLCLSALPSPMSDDLQELLANFMASVIRHQGDHGDVTSKRVRNFTISFGSNQSANAFSKIASQYNDTIEKYSDCGLGFSVERSRGGCCGRF